MTCCSCPDSCGGCQSVHRPYLNSGEGCQYELQVRVVVRDCLILACLVIRKVACCSCPGSCGGCQSVRPHEQWWLLSVGVPGCVGLLNINYSFR